MSRSADNKMYILLQIDAFEKVDTYSELTVNIKEGIYDGFQIVYDPTKEGSCRMVELDEYLAMSINGPEY